MERRPFFVFSSTLPSRIAEDFAPSKWNHSGSFLTPRLLRRGELTRCGDNPYYFATNNFVYYFWWGFNLCAGEQGDC